MRFKSYLEDMSFEELIPLWNVYASCQSPDDYIYYSLEEFAELSGEDGVELARKLFFVDVKNCGDKVYLNGYSNLHSCWSVQSSPIVIDALVDFMKEENHQVYEEWCKEQNNA